MILFSFFFWGYHFICYYFTALSSPLFGIGGMGNGKWEACWDEKRYQSGGERTNGGGFRNGMKCLPVPISLFSLHFWAKKENKRGDGMAMGDKHYLLLL